MIEFPDRTSPLNEASLHCISIISSHSYNAVYKYCQAPGLLIKHFRYKELVFQQAQDKLRNDDM